jgi:hypothetical protein
VRHPDVAGRGVENERVLGVKPFPAGHDLDSAAATNGGNLGRRWRAAELDEARIGQIAQREVVFIHPAFQLLRARSPRPPLSPSVLSIDVQRAESAVLRPLLPLMQRASEWQAISVTHGGEFS